MNYIKDIKNLNGKVVLLRLDLNVPINKKKIQDDTRVLINLPLLKDLIKKKAKIIIISHLGRPNGEKLAKFYLFLFHQLSYHF